MKKKKNLLLIIIIVLILAIIANGIIINKAKVELVSVKSEKKLLSIYNNENGYSRRETILKVLMDVPIFLLTYGMRTSSLSNAGDSLGETSSSAYYPSDFSVDNTNATTTLESSTKSYSTTNLQVENVDEADINKTDGNYIYSISEDKVVITNVQDPANLKIEAKIRSSEDDYIPEDLLLYNNKLVIISSVYINYSKSNTLVDIYDITNKSKPKSEKSYILYEKYYTSRCINNNLYVISSGNLRKSNDKIDTYYSEDNEQKDIGFSNIEYIKGQETDDQTLIAALNLDELNDVKINSYLFNVENAYVSTDNLYLLNDGYNDSDNTIWRGIKHIFSFKGLIAGIKELADDEYDDYKVETNIYKFNIKEDGKIQYQNKAKVEGSTINQFSLDEYDENLRVGLYSYDKGSRIVVFDKNLKQMGETEYLSPEEKMYSTRFVGNKAYLVTYKNTDPLYVIDLSNPTDPKVLGKLKIPGYSTYLQPYDDTHIIGIGMQTETQNYKNTSGKVTSTRTVITGMKMALFDISDLNNPVQISQTLIGDKRTTSAVLTNHKALLFSKEKGILAIPVNNYDSDFEINTSDSDSISSAVSSYTNYSSAYVSEGYLVYSINTEDGFKLKGTITHNNITKTNNQYNYYYTNTQLLRGLWIENNLFTISEDMIKVNNLDTLAQISEKIIKGDN